MGAFVWFSNTLSNVSDLFGRSTQEDDERWPDIIRLNINADAHKLIEQERLEQWRRWAEASGGNPCGNTLLASRL